MNSMMAVILLAAVLAVSVSSSDQGQYFSQGGGVSSWGGSFGSQSAFGNNFKNYGTQGGSRGFGSQVPSPSYGRPGQTGWPSGGYPRSSGQQFSRNYSQRFPGSNSLSLGNQGLSGSYGGQRNFGFQGISGSQGSYGRLFHLDHQGSSRAFGDQGNYASAGQQRYGQNVFNPSRGSTYGVPQGQSFSQQRVAPYGTQQGNFVSGFQG